MPLIDRLLPNHQFSERHETRVRCPPGELLDLIQGWDPRDRFADIAMALRQTPARHAAPRPFGLKSFTPLGRDGDRAMVAGLIGQFWRNDFGLVRIERPEAFIAFDAPGTPKLALGFEAEPAGELTRLITETARVLSRPRVLSAVPTFLAADTAGERPHSPAHARRDQNHRGAAYRVAFASVQRLVTIRPSGRCEPGTRRSLSPAGRMNDAWPRYDAPTRLPLDCRQLASQVRALGTAEGSGRLNLTPRAPSPGSG